jgi:hypothetical protein
MSHPIQLIRNAAITEEIDYNLIIGCLQDFSAPRDVITRMLRAAELIRVKKGIYVFGKNYSKRPYSLEVLANMIYGPSYVSCEYALSLYGLIPEAAQEVTSMTIGRNKLFDTPVGRFSYLHLPILKYKIGLERLRISDEIGALIASPEKALADTVFKRKEVTANIHELRAILHDDYRIDPLSISSLRVGLMDEIAKAYKHPSIQLLPAIVREAKKRKSFDSKVESAFIKMNT